MRRIASALAGLALLTACGTEQRAPTASTLAAQSQVAASRGESERGDESNRAVERDLAALRRLTAPFHDFSVARAAGWSTQITPCMTDPNGAGGMGFHYGNTAFIDGTAQVLRPQLLLFEPEEHGRMRLVAVEYIIPYTLHRRDAAPPELFGQRFKQVDAFQLWGLHAWVWRENRRGIFADWNPRVDCDDTASRMVMAH
jgi:hypothetical protein